MDTTTERVPDPTPGTCADCNKPAAGYRREGRLGAGAWFVARACVEHRTHDTRNQPIREEAITRRFRAAVAVVGREPASPTPHRSRVLAIILAAMGLACVPEAEPLPPLVGVRETTSEREGSEGCHGGSTGDAGSSEGSEEGNTTGEDSGSSEGSEGSEEGNGGSSDDGGPVVCDPPDHMPCDWGTNDPFRAMGLDCFGEWLVNPSTSGAAAARGVRGSFGATNAYDPREGMSYAVIGTGNVVELGTATPAGDSNASPTNCSDDLGGGASLPPPLATTDATLSEAFDAGATVHDYSEIRFSAQVPPGVASFSYVFAFASTEWPYNAGASYSDTFVGWLESEQWTGNVSFDASGNPITIGASFLEYAGTDPQLADTCMRQHAATDWLTTSAGVSPGESITLVFAIFDAGDSLRDSFAFIDAFEWSCDPVVTPITSEAV